MNRILIVAASPINRIVIARIIERIFLKADAVAPDAALKALREHQPAVVIIDGASRDTLLAELAQRRRASEKNLPRIVVVSDSLQRNESWPFFGLADAVVAKPITADVLQPAVERLIKEI